MVEILFVLRCPLSILFDSLGVLRNLVRSERERERGEIFPIFASSSGSERDFCGFLVVLVPLTVLTYSFRSVPECNFLVIVFATEERLASPCNIADEGTRVSSSAVIARPF